MHRDPLGGIAGLRGPDVLVERKIRTERFEGIGPRGNAKL